MMGKNNVEVHCTFHFLWQLIAITNFQISEWLFCNYFVFEVVTIVKKGLKFEMNIGRKVH